MRKIPFFVVAALLASAGAASASQYEGRFDSGGKSYVVRVSFAAQKNPTAAVLDTQNTFTEGSRLDEADETSTPVTQSRAEFSLGTAVVSLLDGKTGAPVSPKAAAPVRLSLDKSDWSGAASAVTLSAGAVKPKDASFSIDAPLSISPAAAAGEAYPAVSVEVMFAPGAAHQGCGTLAAAGPGRLALAGFDAETVPARMVAVVSAREKTKAGEPYWGASSAVALTPVK